MNASATLRLPPVLDLRAASPLAADLLVLRGRPVRIDASAVTAVGALCLQVLIAARRTWKTDGTELIIADASPAFIEQTALLGDSQLGAIGGKTGT